LCVQYVILRKELEMESDINKYPQITEM